MNQILRAIRAFILINTEEAQGIEYIDRLAHFATICVDEDTFNIATKMFDNDNLCKIMISYLERIN